MNNFHFKDRNFETFGQEFVEKNIEIDSYKPEDFDKISFEALELDMKSDSYKAQHFFNTYDLKKNKDEQSNLSLVKKHWDANGLSIKRGLKTVNLDFKTKRPKTVRFNLESTTTRKIQSQGWPKEFPTITNKYNFSMQGPNLLNHLPNFGSQFGNADSSSSFKYQQANKFNNHKQNSSYKNYKPQQDFIKKQEFFTASNSSWPQKESMMHNSSSHRAICASASQLNPEAKVFVPRYAYHKGKYI